MISETACQDIMRSLNGCACCFYITLSLNGFISGDKNSLFKDINIMTSTKNGYIHTRGHQGLYLVNWKTNTEEVLHRNPTRKYPNNLI